MTGTLVRKTRRARRPGRGALVVIAVLLAGSGVIRLGGGASHAFARTTETVALATDGQICEPDAGALAMLYDLKAREARLIERESAQAERAQVLSLTESQVTQTLAALVAAEEKLSGTIAMADQASEGDIARLTSVYENMKPKDAMPLFEEMAPEFAAGFLGRMRPDAAAAIMAGLKPKTAYTISVLLAGRNANVPRN